MDDLEGREIGTHVERESMIADPSADRDPDRGDLALLDPDAGPAGDGARLDPEVPQRLAQDLFESAQEPVQVASARLEIHDRVAHELPRSMPRDVPPARDLEQL